MHSCKSSGVTVEYRVMMSQPRTQPYRETRKSASPGPVHPAAYGAAPPSPTPWVEGSEGASPEPNVS